MPTVSEQIQLYRAFKAQNSDDKTVTADTDLLTLEKRHPKTNDYFKMLMQQWQNSYRKKSSS